MDRKIDFYKHIDSDIDEIVEMVQEITKLNLRSINQLKDIINRSSFPNKLEVINVPDELFVTNIVICLFYSSFDPLLAQTPIMDGFQNKIKSVCKELGLDISLTSIVPLTKIEKELHSILR